jgi:hypothetical protein
LTSIFDHLELMAGLGGEQGQALAVPARLGPAAVQIRVLGPDIYIYIYIYIYIAIKLYTHTQTHTHARTHITHAHARTQHTHTHTHTHTRTHTHTTHTNNSALHSVLQKIPKFKNSKIQKFKNSLDSGGVCVYAPST